MKNLPVPPPLRDKLGDAGSDALHEMFADAHALATESFERRLAEEAGKLRLDIANLKFEQQPDTFSVAWDVLEPMTTPRGLANPGEARAALERAVAEIRREYGSERVAWGDVHRFRFGGIDLPGDGAAGRHGVFRVVTFEDADGGQRVAGHIAPGRRWPASAMRGCCSCTSPGP